MLLSSAVCAEIGSPVTLSHGVGAVSFAQHEAHRHFALRLLPEVGDCGGAMSCATCHVVVEEQFAALLPAPDDTENQMLDFTAAPRQASSRLSCQIRVSDDLDGLIVVKRLEHELVELVDSKRRTAVGGGLSGTIGQVLS